MTSRTAPARPAWATLAFSAVLLVSLYVLFVPQPVGPAGPPGADKAVHAALFAALAVTTRLRFGAALPLVVAIGGYGIGSEVIQAVLLPARGGDVLDVIADLAGAAAGWSWPLTRRSARPPDRLTLCAADVCWLACAGPRRTDPRPPRSRFAPRLPRSAPRDCPAGRSQRRVVKIVAKAASADNDANPARRSSRSVSAAVAQF